MLSKPSWGGGGTGGTAVVQARGRRGREYDGELEEWPRGARAKELCRCIKTGGWRVTVEALRLLPTKGKGKTFITRRAPVRARGPDGVDDEPGDTIRSNHWEGCWGWDWGCLGD